MRLAVLLLIASACGRVAFEPLGDAGADLDAQVPAELIAWYRMDTLEPAGLAQVDRDSSGHGHHAECGADTNCPGVVPGRVDGGFEFENSAALRVAYTKAFHTPDAFTVMTWLRIDVVTTSDQCALSKILGEDFFNTWQLCLLSNRRFLFYSHDGTFGNDLVSPASYPIGVWHHIALRWDGSTKSLLVDGAEVASSATQLAWDDGDLWIGRDVNNGSPGLAFSGSLDDVRVYRRALAFSEIAAVVAEAP